MDLEQYEDFRCSQDEWEKEHYIQYFFVDTWNFFRYRLPYRIGCYKDEVRFAWQRVFRGFDDRWYWNYDSENAQQTLKVLRWLKENKHGYPATMTQEGDDDSQAVWEYNEERWNGVLQKMIDGFQAYLDIEEVHILINGKYDHEKSQVERDRLEHIWQEGSKLFIIHYRGLWD